MKTDSTATRTLKTRTRSDWGWILALVLTIATVSTGACQTAPPKPIEHAAQAERPILILVSLDGWRWDYLDRAVTPRLNALAASGVRSEGLIPQFPSKTFPSHYTIVTGLYPEHHGIVANNMLDATIGERFSMAAPTSRDSRWWGGEPLWVTAERQGHIAASMFWPGSEVDIGGVRPSHWRPFVDATPNRERVQQVLDWLQLPELQRPSFLTLYFSTVDTIGHTFGPNSTEVLEAAAGLDEEIGALVDGVNALGGLSSRVHYVIVSDHGMSETANDRIVTLDDYINVDTVDIIGVSPVVGLWPRTDTVDHVYAALKDKHPSLSVYRREEVPAALHYNSNPRIPPIVTIADDGWSVGTQRQVSQWRNGTRSVGGNHGYDPSAKSMQGLLIAVGPQFRRGLIIPPIENIHLYEMMAHVLGLRPAANDGDASATTAMFRD